MAFPHDYDICEDVEQLDTTIELVDYTRIENMILSAQQYLCDCSVNSSAVTNTRLDVLESGLRQVIAEVTEDVQEIQTIHEKTGFRVVV